VPELRRNRAAAVHLVVGSPGSGKSHYVRRAIDAPRPRDARGVRVRVWDYKDDHYTLPTLTLQQLARAALDDGAVRYVPRRDATLDQQFQMFCRIVWAAQELDPASDCRVVVEEAQKVLRAGVRNEHWENLSEVGRAYGFTVFIVTTRPAYVDLGCRGAANFLRVGRLGEADDAREMGKRLGVPYGAIQRLPDHWAYVYDGKKTDLVNPRGKVVPHVRKTG
jgi:hypothetical protein